jgi:hypothetical protein
MKRIFLLAAAMAAATPAVAQVGPPAAPGAIEAQPVESGRLAAATAVVEYLWPLGTFERLMRGPMDQLMDSMFDIRLSDLAPGMNEDGKKTKQSGSDMTLREMMAKGDPHFDERMKITDRVLVEELVPILSRVEPAVQAGLSRAYARKFTVEQLGEMRRFFATPAGGAFASESMLLWMDPEIVTAMVGVVPEVMKEMPRIGQKLQEATAHLPPPPEPPKERRKSRR